MTAIILAGGKSSRMGDDKAFLKIGNQPLIKRQIGLLRKLFKKIIIVTNSLHKYKGYKGIKIISDIIPHRGPLAGIYSGLLASTSTYNFVVACDMPFINLGLIKYMCKKVRSYDIVIPKLNNRYEPLFCIYSRNCLAHIKGLLDKKIFKVRRLFAEVRLKEISKKEILRFGLPKTMFTNINTLKDLGKIRHEGYVSTYNC